MDFPTFAPVTEPSPKIGGVDLVVDISYTDVQLLPRAFQGTGMVW